MRRLCQCADPPSSSQLLCPSPLRSLRIRREMTSSGTSWPWSMQDFINRPNSDKTDRERKTESWTNVSLRSKKKTHLMMFLLSSSLYQRHSLISSTFKITEIHFRRSGSQKYANKDAQILLHLFIFDLFLGLACITTVETQRGTLSLLQIYLLRNVLGE